MINCTKCKTEKDECEFRSRPTLKRGYNSWCKECESKANLKRYIPKEKNVVFEKDKETIKINAKIRMLKYRYDITYEEYEKMYLTQEKKCLICEKEYELGGRNGLYVDHCHKTNNVRGLLCPGCNVAIGVLREDKKIFENAIRYLNL